MDVQYLVDEKGQKTAVVVSLADWEALRIRNLEYAEDVTEEEITEAEASWAEYQASPEAGRSLAQVRKALLEDRLD